MVQLNWFDFFKVNNISADERIKVNVCIFYAVLRTTNVKLEENDDFIMDYGNS